MNKNLFVIFLLVVSSGLCASDSSSIDFDYPGGNPVRDTPPSHYVMETVVDPSEALSFLVPSQISSNTSTPSSTPEQARRADERKRAGLAALENAKR